ncbi:MAG: ISAs1 family transposase [Xenococcaceae cyanobacterium MO_167.B52]|nr:ISAs1 family transposase [Xenococcaceae cyanobacterium MO_167.B52]
MDYLKEIPDEWDSHGRRHPLWLILIIMIMGIMIGYWGYRELGRFIERHRRELIKMFQVSRAEMPSYSTIRRVMIQLDYEEVTRVFNEWASQYTHYQKGQWIALDGKSLKNTVSNCHNSQQNFITMVSAFSHQRGEVLGLKVMENKKESEINMVRKLIELLDLSEVIFTMDALHCQKKHFQLLSKAVMTI